MKYNKIAMLVAGGLMVGASGAAVADNMGAVTADIPEFGTITGLSDSAVEITAALTGSNTLADLNTSPVVEDTFCYQGNTSSVATTHSTLGWVGSAYTVNAAETAITPTSGTLDMGGYNYTITANKLAHNSYTPTGVSDDEDKIIEYTIQLSSDVTQNTTEHLDDLNSGTYGSLCAAEPYTMKVIITDVNKNLKAGNYSLGGSQAGTNTITLSGNTDE